MNKSDISYLKPAGPLTFRFTQELSWQPFSVGWWLCRHHE